MLCYSVCGHGRIVGADAPDMRTSAEGAGVQEEADGKSAAQVIEVVAHHATSLIGDGPSPLIDSL